jgi:hypothetical protein
MKLSYFKIGRSVCFLWTKNGPHDWELECVICKRLQQFEFPDGSKDKISRQELIL